MNIHCLLETCAYKMYRRRVPFSVRTLLRDTHDYRTDLPTVLFHEFKRHEAYRNTYDVKSLHGQIDDILHDNAGIEDIMYSSNHTYLKMRDQYWRDRWEYVHRRRPQSLFRKETGREEGAGVEGEFYSEGHVIIDARNGEGVNQVTHARCDLVVRVLKHVLGQDGAVEGFADLRSAYEAGRKEGVEKYLEEVGRGRFVHVVTDNTASNVVAEEAGKKVRVYVVASGESRSGEFEEYMRYSLIYGNRISQCVYMDSVVDTRGIRHYLDSLVFDESCNGVEVIKLILKIDTRLVEWLRGGDELHKEVCLEIEDMIKKKTWRYRDTDVHEKMKVLLCDIL